MDTRAGFSSGPPRRLPGPPRWVSRSDVSYNVAPDGQRFLVLRPASEAASPTELVVVLGWAEEVRRLARPAAGS